MIVLIKNTCDQTEVDKLLKSVKSFETRINKRIEVEGNNFAPSLYVKD